jgi:hypothetical protein
VSKADDSREEVGKYDMRGKWGMRHVGAGGLGSTDVQAIFDAGGKRTRT